MSKTKTTVIVDEERYKQFKHVQVETKKSLSDYVEEMMDREIAEHEKIKSGKTQVNIEALKK